MRDRAAGSRARLSTDRVKPVGSCRSTNKLLI
jgi:hypothetical protein